MTNIIPNAIITAITGATDAAEINMQGCAIIEMLEEFLGVLLVKRDISDEKITLPYSFSRVIKPKFAPLNSVASLEVITKNGNYKADTSTISIGAYTIELLPRFWYFFGLPYPLWPKAVSAIKLSYNAGYFSTWQELPAILQQAAVDLLKYKYASELKAGFHSEHLGDYSYTRGALVRGLPVDIASSLEGLIL
jgi:hypothetical protein